MPGTVLVVTVETDEEEIVEALDAHIERFCREHNVKFEIEVK